MSFAVKLRGDLAVWLLLLQCGVCVTLVRGDCAKPPRLNNGFPDVDLSLTSFSVGTRIRYRCYPGYLVAEGKSPLITCQADTSWTAIRTECEARSCGVPPDIEHGSYQTTSIVFGGRVTYRCDEGYELVGKATQNCVAEGWDGRSPECDQTRDTSPVTVSGGSGTQMTSGPHPTSESETRNTSPVTVSGGSGTQMTSSPHPTSDSETRNTSPVTVSGGSGTQMTSGPHPTSESASHIDRSFIYGQNLLLVLLLLLERIL